VQYRLLVEAMLIAPESVAQRWSVSQLPGSLLAEIADLQAPEFWSKNHTEVVVPVEALHEES
jgi:hypothetical protein